MKKAFLVTVAGASVGWVAMETTVDLWQEPLFAHPADIGDWSKRLGVEHCVAHPDSAETPHALQWAHLADRTLGETYSLLYCDACKCLVSPPTDGYGCYHEYPKEWLPQ